MAGVMYPLFGVSGAGASALILGLLGGYPVGARTVAELYGRGEIGREEAEQLLAFCNNPAPAFFSACAARRYSAARGPGAYLYLIHVGAALVTGVLLRRDLGLPRRKAVSRQRAPFDLAAALPAAVQSSFVAVGSVSAFVIFFHGAAGAPVARARARCAAAAAARGAVRLFGDDERRERPVRHAHGLCALRRYHELGRAERAGADVRDACGERPCPRGGVIGKAVQALAGVPPALLAAQRLSERSCAAAWEAILRVAFAAPLYFTKERRTAAMPNLFPITDFADPALDVYARLTENQLVNREDLSQGLFIAESPKVIERALNAGYVPVSFLMEPRHVETQARDILGALRRGARHRAADAPKQLTGFPLTRGCLRHAAGRCRRSRRSARAQSASPCWRT